MDKKLILAVAGSGKTSYIVNCLNQEKKSLIVTYTINNFNNLKNKILIKFGYIPEKIKLYSYYNFLYSFCYRPFLSSKLKTTGISWKIPPVSTFKLKRTDLAFYMNKKRRLYSNRIAKLLETKCVLQYINDRIEKYFDNFFIDEIQDFSGHDFNLLKSISLASIDIIYVGDFYQYTYDTSRDGNINSNIHNDYHLYIKIFKDLNFVIEENLLRKSYRCSPSICEFIKSNFGIQIESNRNDNTTIGLLTDEKEIKRIFHCFKTIKLFYQKHYTYNCYSKNWGESKGSDNYFDVCVILNKNTYKHFCTNKLNSLCTQTKNKLYVACTRAKGNVYFIEEDLLKKIIS